MKAEIHSGVTGYIGELSFCTIGSPFIRIDCCSWCRVGLDDRKECLGISTRNNFYIPTACCCGVSNNPKTYC